MVVLTTYDYDELVFEAICAGAQAYLLKDASGGGCVGDAASGSARRIAPVAGHRRQGIEQFRALCPPRFAS